MGESRRKPLLVGALHELCLVCQNLVDMRQCPNVLLVGYFRVITRSFYLDQNNLLFSVALIPVLYVTL